MQRLCPNCGDPVEPDEIFCDKCGTKVGADTGQQSQYQTPMPGAYQTPAPNAYQTPYQSPTPGFSENQYPYAPGQQQNIPPYTPPPAYIPPQYNQYQKPKTGSKVLKIVFISISVVAILIVALGIISIMTEDKGNKTTNNSSQPAATSESKPAVVESKPAVVESKKPAAESSSQPASNQMMVTWDGDIDVNSTYNASEQKIYVDYSIILKNVGKANAQNVNVYLDPESSDENAKYLGMKPKTIVNFDGIIKQINAGQQQEIKTKFFYNNIEASKANQSNLQDIANRYLKLPVLIEWEENGKKYTDRKVPH